MQSKLTWNTVYGCALHPYEPSITNIVVVNNLPSKQVHRSLRRTIDASPFDAINQRQLGTMTSILTSPSHIFPNNNIMAQMDTPVMGQMHDPSLQRRSKSEMDGGKNRGRRRSRPTQQKNKEGSVEGSLGEDLEGHSSGTDGNPRKRRRSRKGLDKKFECPQDGCGKSYSRAEHL